MKSKKLAACALLIAAGHLHAAQINFTSGTPALAADVNANFTELYNAEWTRTGTDLSYSGGNVGIGVATPLSVFHVNTGAPGQAVFGTGLANAIRIYPDTEPAFIWDSTTNLRFGTMTAINAGFSEKMRIQANGNVGIGTASPGARLHLLQSAAGITGGVRLADGSEALNIYGSGDGHFHLNPANGTSNIILADTGGKVGIGAPNPNGRLDVRDTSLGDGGVVAYFGEDVGGMKIRRLNVGADSDRIGFSLQQAGTDYFFWIGIDGNLRTQASLPGSANGGTIVGDQTSTRSSKQDIFPFQENDNALAKILTAKLHRFRYKNEVIGYKEQAKYHIGFIADEVHPDFMDAFGKTIDQVSVNGMLIGSVQRLNQKIELRNAEVIALNTALRQAHSDAKEAKARAAKLEKRLAEESTARQRQELRLVQLEQTLSRIAHRVENPNRAVAQK